MFRFVIARYHENSDWINNLAAPATIYEKGTEPIANGHPPHHVHVHLPNVGKEAHSYFTHICTHYEDLDEYTIFLQGNPFDHSPNLWQQLQKLFLLPKEELDAYSMVVLSEKMVKFTLTDCKYHPKLPLVTVYHQIFSEEESMPGMLDPLYFGAGAQFVVSRSQIRKRPPSFYRRIVELLEKELNPIEGYVIERFFPLIFFAKEISQPFFHCELEAQKEQKRRLRRLFDERKQMQTIRFL